MDTSQTQVAVLETKFSQLLTITDKISTTVDKIADISGELQRISDTHTLRIDTNEENTQRLSGTINKVQDDFQASLDELHQDVLKQLSSTEDRIMAAITTIQTNLTTNVKDQKAVDKELNGRVGKLEKWRYVLVGIGLTVGILIRGILPSVVDKVFGVGPIIH